MDESAAFQKLQERLAPMYQRVFPDPQRPRTVVVVPSLSLDRETLEKVEGVHHYEERMLGLLMLLRLPRTRVVYLTSDQISPAIVDYYLNLMAGVPPIHARERLTILSCYDRSPVPLTQKLLDRPRILERVRKAIGDPRDAHLACFTVTPLERRLALELDVPIFGCDPDLLPLGSKSGSRTIFREAGILLPAGAEDLRDMRDVAEALADLKGERPELRRAVVKLNEGFSGEGNAVFRFDGAPEEGLRAWIEERLPEGLEYEAAREGWDSFSAKFAEMGGIVEEFVEGEHKVSPSVQYRVEPTGELVELSTHDQHLGGATGQVFKGASFPAHPEYRGEIQEAGRRAAQILASRGVVGRFAIDFVSVREGAAWRHYAIEVNLRKGGTTHPFLMLQFLTDGHYDAGDGLYRTPSGQVRCYFASDNLESEAYRGLTPYDLIDIAVRHQLHFHAANQQGVVFHLIGALSEYGKLGVVCVGDEPATCQAMYQQTVEILEREGSSAGDRG